MKIPSAWLAALLCLVTVSFVEVQGLPTARPEQVGLSSERLNRLTATLKADVEKGAIPGGVVLVARHGRVALFEAIGVRNPETKAPMTKDAIFRIYSMSKPITSVSAMMLFEEGKFSLADPVSRGSQRNGLRGDHEARCQITHSSTELDAARRSC